jgi:hypothetical protein
MTTYGVGTWLPSSGQLSDLLLLPRLPLLSGNNLGATNAEVFHLRLAQ